MLQSYTAFECCKNKRTILDLKRKKEITLPYAWWHSNQKLFKITILGKEMEKIYICRGGKGGGVNIFGKSS